MRAPRLIALTLAGALCAWPARADQPLDFSAEPADWQPISLVYEIHAGGLHVFTINLEATLTAEDYDVSLDLLTDGALSWLFDWSMLSTAKGRPAAPRPSWFRTESRWNDNLRWVELRYGENAAPSVELVPRPEEDDRPSVPEALRKDTVDPLSAGIALIYRLARRNDCAAELPVFDGRRLFRARSRDLGPRKIPVSALAPFGGAARACALEVEPVTGFWRKQRTAPKTQELTAYFRPLSAGGPPLLLRIDAETRFGAVRAHLVEVSPRPGKG